MNDKRCNHSKTDRQREREREREREWLGRVGGGGGGGGLVDLARGNARGLRWPMNDKRGNYSKTVLLAAQNN